MNPLTLRFILVCLAAVLAALVGWFTRPVRFPLSKYTRFCVLMVASAVGFGLGFVVPRGWIEKFQLAVLFVCIASAFNGWRKEPEPPKGAFVCAFLGAGYLLLQTTQQAVSIGVGLTLMLIGPRLALWVTKHTHRAVGLALVSGAAVLQLSRVPFLLAPPHVHAPTGPTLAELNATIDQLNRMTEAEQRAYTASHARDPAVRARFAAPPSEGRAR